jgi:beta-galactosidase
MENVGCFFRICDPETNKILKNIKYTFIERKKVRQVNCIPIDISKFCNMGFVDDKAGDGKGGWADQGAENDLRSVPLGNVEFKGVLFLIIDPMKNQGKSCIVLKGEHSQWGVKEAKGIKVNLTTPCLYFLHSCAWTKQGEEIAKYVVNYTSGEKIEIPIVGGKNVNDWWASMSDIQEAEMAWSGPNLSAGEVCLWLFPWKNPKPDKEIESIDIVSNEKVSGVLGLVAISAEK